MTTALNPQDITRRKIGTSYLIKSVNTYGKNVINSGCQAAPTSVPSLHYNTKLSSSRKRVQEEYQKLLKLKIGILPQRQVRHSVVKQKPRDRRTIDGVRPYPYYNRLKDAFQQLTNVTLNPTSDTAVAQNLIHMPILVPWERTSLPYISPTCHAASLPTTTHTSLFMTFLSLLALRQSSFLPAPSSSPLYTKDYG